VLRNIGPVHIFILLAVIILVFGAKRLPDVAKSVGQSMKIFKSEIQDLRTDDAPPADATANAPSTAQNTYVTPPVVVQTPVVPTPVRPEPTEGSAPPKV